MLSKKCLSFLKYHVLSLLLLSPLLQAEDVLSTIKKNRTLKVGLTLGYMPFEMSDKKGRPVGFDIDLANLMAKEMGVKLKIVNLEWDGIIPALLTKKFDMIISGMSVTPKRNMRVNFSNPYITIGQTILIKGSLKDKIKSFRDLNNKKYTVASKIGTTGELAIQKFIPKAKYKSYQNVEDGALEVKNQRVDAFVYDYPYNSIFMNSNGKSSKIHFLDKPFTFEPLAIAVRQNDINILNFLNNFIRQIKGDGTYDRLYKKWFDNTKWLKNVK